LPDVERPPYRLSSTGDVFLTTFLLGPLAGLTVIAWNYLVLRRRLACALTLVVGFGAALGAAATLAEDGEGPWAGPAVLIGLGGLAILPLISRLLQGRAYDEHLDRGGEKASGWKALGLGLCGIVAFFGLIFALALAELVVTGDRILSVTAGEEIYYGRDVSEAEARGLGEVLREAGLFNGRGHKTVRLTRSDGRPRVWVVLTERHHDPVAAVQFDRLRRQVSQRVFSGGPVEMVLCDENLNVKKTLP
jgi:hypothetical protein